MKNKPLFWLKEKEMQISNHAYPRFYIISKEGVIGYIQKTVYTTADRWARGNLKSWQIKLLENDAAPPQTPEAKVLKGFFTDRLFRYIGQADNLAAAKKLFIEEYSQSDDAWFDHTDDSRSVLRLPCAENNSFYPTPSRLAGAMFGKVQNWDKVKRILEPSAGTGNLIVSLKRFMATCRRNRPEDVIIDLIEKDPNLSTYLVGAKLGNLIHDDFLTFRSNSCFDLILQNPPFENGDEHLLKSIDIMEACGGQIVCLLNAETIRNPYTNRRKLLKQKLTSLNASIEFVEGGFRRSQHPTDVETAIVYINIPRPKRASSFYEGMKRAAEEEKSERSDEPNALLVSDEILALISQYNVEAGAGVQFIREYLALAPYILDSTDSEYSQSIIQLSISGHELRTRYYTECEYINRYLRALRLKYWSMLGKNKTLRERMTTKMSDEYYHNIESMAEYEFSRFNIGQLLYKISNSLLDGIYDAILSLFETLTEKHSWYPECEKTIHYYNGWKTNLAHKIGKKCIIPVDGYSYNKELDIYRISKFTSDLERSMRFLDCGQTSYFRDVEHAVRFANGTESNEINFTYFKMKFYKKGTCHITFHDSAMPIIDRLNIYVGKNKNWLPPNYGVKHYADLNDEEREVIDSFHDNSIIDYEDVVNNPGNYIIGKQQLLLAVPS